MTNAKRIITTILIGVCLLSIANARSFPKQKQKNSEYSENSSDLEGQPSDLMAAATGHHHGRVQIKVYRGPDTHGDHHEHFAPHGYWVKQPADENHHH